MLADQQRLEKELEQESVGREATEDRTKLLEEITKKESRLDQVDSDLARFAEFDPEEIKKLEESTKKIREATNRWVDNIFNCQAWISKQFNIDKKDFSAQFGIPAELDYIEE